ncbi:MAG: deoxyguanosinetriphosphate triphosphohydrolase [Victivallales bacterium]|nr:deoxyguanosinetriphosphate triphosphohydrolase [Victivallales bacterium]
MLKELADQYQCENSSLAPYAVRNRDSHGRRFPEKSHPFRTNFQRDRDRVLHSKAFRRLEYKTQVFLNGSGDHYRTRLTHTIEVAAVARTIARALSLNEDLAETIALAHDLGHTPFGHAGERQMNRLMIDDGGFDHNMQALKVIDELEIKYPDYNGLNLTWEVRAGLLKHRENGDMYLDGVKLPRNPVLEAQVADLADDLTYYGHDVDDGIDSGLLTQDMLMELDIWRKAVTFANKAGLKPGSERYMSFSVRNLIDMMVKDAIVNSHQAIVDSGVNSVEAVQHSGSRLIVLSSEFREITGQLHKFLFDFMYFHADIKKVNDVVSEKMQRLFHYYIANPGDIGESARGRIESAGLKRAVTDYIAGMTDRFAELEFNRIFKN